MVIIEVNHDEFCTIKDRCYDLLSMCELNPIIAAAAMSLSSVSVLTNALRLKRFKPFTKEEDKSIQSVNVQVYETIKIVTVTEAI